MKSLWRRWRTPAPILASEHLDLLFGQVPWIARLTPDRQARLLALVAQFLADKSITPVQGLVLDMGQRLRLAALACLPLLEFGAQGLHGWHQVVVYPGAFRVQRQHHDEDTGVVAEWMEELSGESWEHGPLVLSWDDIEREHAEPEAGYALVAHEMAHKLDALDGVMDGTPPLPRDWQQAWALDFQAAYARLCDTVDAGLPCGIDDYAAEAPEEFFAVASEYHFSDPATLAREMPAVAAHLARFYGPSPLVPA